MKLFEKLNRDNFELFAAQHYNNMQCTTVDEFKEDLNRFRYIKRLLSRYDENEDLQERLILNHLIVIYNVFGIEAANRMIWYKIDYDHWPVIKPFLVFLHYLPDDEKIDIIMDPVVVERLRDI